VALSEAVKKFRFVYYLHESSGTSVKLSITVMIDHIGAIFMGENISSGGRTRHIYTPYHFIREQV
jgi:hypothetical protein